MSSPEAVLRGSGGHDDWDDCDELIACSTPPVVDTSRSARDAQLLEAWKARYEAEKMDHARRGMDYFLFGARAEMYASLPIVDVRQMRLNHTNILFVGPTCESRMGHTFDVLSDMAWWWFMKEKSRRSSSVRKVCVHPDMPDVNRYAKAGFHVLRRDERVDLDNINIMPYPVWREASLKLRPAYGLHVPQLIFMSNDQFVERRKESREFAASWKDEMTRAECAVVMSTTTYYNKVHLGGPPLNGGLTPKLKSFIDAYHASHPEWTWTTILHHYSQTSSVLWDVHSNKLFRLVGYTPSPIDGFDGIPGLSKPLPGKPMLSFEVGEASVVGAAESESDGHGGGKAEVTDVE
jgi:hypothetical protein